MNSRAPALRARAPRARRGRARAQRPRRVPHAPPSSRCASGRPGACCARCRTSRAATRAADAPRAISRARAARRPRAAARARACGALRHRRARTGRPSCPTRAAAAVEAGRAAAVGAGARGATRWAAAETRRHADAAARAPAPRGLKDPPLQARRRRPVRPAPRIPTAAARRASPGGRLRRETRSRSPGGRRRTSRARGARDARIRRRIGRGRRRPPAAGNGAALSEIARGASTCARCRRRATERATTPPGATTATTTSSCARSTTRRSNSLRVRLARVRSAGAAAQEWHRVVGDPADRAPGASVSSLDGAGRGGRARVDGRGPRAVKSRPSRSSRRSSGILRPRVRGGQSASAVLGRVLPRHDRLFEAAAREAAARAPVPARARGARALTGNERERAAMEGLARD